MGYRGPYEIRVEEKDIPRETSPTGHWPSSRPAVAITGSGRLTVDGDALVEQFEYPNDDGVVDGGIADPD